MRSVIKSQLIPSGFSSFDIYNIVTGPAVVALMRQQAIEFGAKFEADTVVGIDTSERPLKVKTNSSVIETHSIIVATGAESNWLNVKGEYEMRGGGVSSCATCDGHIYRGKHVLVVGGGDTAMEDALVLARTSEVRRFTSSTIRFVLENGLISFILCCAFVSLSLLSIEGTPSAHQKF